MSNVTITIGEIVNLCAFAGIEVNKEQSVFHNEDEQLETPITIYQKTKLHNDDGKEIYDGIAAMFSEYPEEGMSPLADESH